jgi:hypothetical protein
MERRVCSTSVWECLRPHACTKASIYASEAAVFTLLGVKETCPPTHVAITHQVSDAIVVKKWKKRK